MKLSIHDHVLIHAMTVLGGLSTSPFDPAGAETEQRMILSMLRDVLPKVQRGEPKLAWLVAIADRVAERPDLIDAIRHDIRASVHDWNRGRLAAAWDAIQEKAA